MDIVKFTERNNYGVFGISPSFGILRTIEYSLSENGSVSVLR
jgi:hypothetical protein